MAAVAVLLDILPMPLANRVDKVYRCLKIILDIAAAQ
jgi:hypothetical protein